MTHRPHDVPAQQQQWPGSDADLTPAADHGATTWVGRDRLVGKRALVTGGDSGIGRAVAIAFAREGAEVLVAHLPEEDADARATVELAGAGTRVVLHAADLRTPQANRELADAAVEQLGGVDVLVCNAGFVQAGAIDETTEETWDRHFDVNVKGYFLAAREAARLMKVQGGGAIVFNASKGAFAPTAGNAAYASSKAAVAALARNLATELGPHGIRVNCFNADFVDTPLMRALIERRAGLRGIDVAAQTEEYRRRNLLNVGPIPAESVAEAALYLVSDRARYTTGAVLTVDGGIKEAMPR